MVVEKSMDVRDFVREDRVHGRIYTDPAIFDLEMERIFGRTWVYVAHETEVANGGDYKTTSIGTQPVIVTRNADDNQVYVLYNRCRHRAATVCQSERGNANYFRCAYHGWTYNNCGELVGVTYRQGYGPEFNYAEMGLVRVPRVASYRGFIFASLAAEGESLEEHLGNARPHLDQVASQQPAGFEVRGGVHKYGYDGNWKFQLDNSLDNYHINVLHRSYLDIVAQRTGKKTVDASNRSATKVLNLGNGHGLQDFRAGLDMDAFGALPFNLLVFPNLVLIGAQIRVIRPVSVDRTEVFLYMTLLNGVAAEVNAMRLRNQEDFFGPAAFGTPDDLEVGVARVRDGLRATANEWILISRGLHNYQSDATGVRSAEITSEMSLQSIYQQWLRDMTAQ